MIRIGHFYPDLLNLYGDRGNILCLRQRLAWRGLDSEVSPILVGGQENLADFDLLFMGGGQDREQNLLAQDLQQRSEELCRILAEGMPMLAICGGFQLLGRTYLDHEGRELSGVGFLDCVTRAGERRLIGNLRAHSKYLQELGLEAAVYGFENHSGRSYLSEGTEALGQVRQGFGNNGEDQTEGAVKAHVIATYCHGSFLPKNPQVADLLLRWALERQGLSPKLESLPDEWEERLRRQLSSLS